MKTRILSTARLSFPLATALAALLAAPAVHAITHTFTPTAAGTYDWTAAGNWDVNGVPASATDAAVTFFANTTTALANGTLAVNTDPAALTLNTLTLNGKGAASAGTTTVNIGTATNTWTFGGTTPTINLNAVYGSQELGITVKPAIALNQNLIITGNGNAGTKPGAPYYVNGHVFSGSISGAYSITKNGSSTLGLAGNSNYSGGTVINAGTIHIGHANAFGTGTVTFAGNAKMIPAYGANLIIPNSLMVNPGVTAEATLINGNYKMTVSGPVAGSGTFYANNSENSGGTATFSNAANTFTGTLKIGSVGNSNPSGTLTVNSLPDSANPIQFNATSTFGGAFQLGAGAATPLVFSSRQIQLISTTNYPASINNVNASAANTITINTDLVAASGAKTLSLGGTNTGANAFNGKIADGTGAISLTKAGAGRWIVSGTNTYTGKVTVSGGTLSIPSIDVVANANPLGQSTAVAANLLLGNGATLRYTGAAASTDRSFTINGTAAGHQATLDASGTGAISFTSTTSPAYGTAAQTRTLNLTGLNTGDNTLAANLGNNTTAAVSLAKSGIGTWALSGTNVNTGTTAVSGGGTLKLNYDTGTGGTDSSKLSDTAALTLSGGTVTLNGGTHPEVVSATTLNTAGTFLTRSGGGTGKLSMNAITRAAGGTLDLADATIADTSTANINGILGGWATLGNDWAVSGSPVTALASYTGTLPQTGGAATDNDTLTGPQIQSGPVLANTVKLAGSGSGDTLDLGANNLTITSTSATSLGGILYVGGGDNNYTLSGTGRILTSSATGELIINPTTGTLTISAPIVTAAATDGILTKTGAGTLVINAANPYTGATNVNQGVLRIANATASGAIAGGIKVQNGAAVELANSAAVGAEALTLVGSGVSSGGALRNIAGNTSSYGGAITIGSGGARINSDSTGALSLSGGIATALFQDVTLGGDGSVTVQTAALSGAGSLVKDGAGTVGIAASMNTYSGDTSVNAGTLQLNSANANNDGSTVTIAATGATLALNFSGTDTVRRLIVGSTPLADGVYNAGNTSQITGTGTLTVNSGGTAPALPGTSIVDNKSGGPVVKDVQVTYTVTFNVDMDASTVDASDFGNAGTASFSIDAITETTPTSGIFTVLVTPTSAGTLRLQVNAGAVLKDNGGSVVNTAAAILDDTTLAITAGDITAPTLTGTSIVDNKGGSAIAPSTQVTYTVTFSEDMDESTVDSTDFGNAGTALFSIDSVTETTSGVFTVLVTPISAGTLQLQVNQFAALTDVAGNPLDTGLAIPDNTTLTVDGTPPALIGTDIVDNKGGNPVEVNTLVTYTVTFSKDMDASTVNANDFGNAGDATVTIGTVTETTPGVFKVQATATSTGVLQLQISATADLRDVVGNALETTLAIVDDTSLTVNPDTTAPAPDPMTWAKAPATSGAYSIVMTATSASDPSGVEYSFECTAGGGNSSGWQSSPTFSDTGLSPETSYSYRVQARDMSPAQTLTGFSSTVSATTAQVATFSSGAAAPTVDGADIANLGAPTGNDKWFFGTRNEGDPADWAKGQTVTTGASGGLLKALTYKTLAGNFKNATTTYTVRVGTLTGTTFNQLVLAAATQTVDTAPGDYLTWTFGTPITLAPNTTYALDVAMVSAIDWVTGVGIPYLETTGSAYAGGQLYQSGPAGGSGAGPTIGVDAAKDRVFHLDIESTAAGYELWKIANAPSGTAAEDYDNDGVSNGVEFVLGGTAAANDLGLLPGVSTSGGNLLFTFQRDQDSIDNSAAVVIEVGTNLVTWPATFTVGANTAGSSAGVTVAKDTSIGFDTITLSVPQAPDATKFARLKVVVTP